MTSDPTNPFPGNIKGPRPGVPVEPFDYPLPADLAERIGSEKPTVHLIIGPNGKCACGTDCKTCTEFVSLLLGKSMPDPTNPERETPTPETDQFRKERLRITGTPEEDYLAEPEIAFARKLELARDSARAEAEQLRERCARLEKAGDQLAESLQIRAVFHPAIQEWGEAKRAALNQPKP